MEKEYQNYLQALLSLLLELPAFDKPTSRDFLLTRIPVANWVRRSDEKGADLLYILQYSVGLSEIHPSGEQKELPLDVLYQNIAVYAPTGSDLGNKIEEQFTAERFLSGSCEVIGRLRSRQVVGRRSDNGICADQADDHPQDKDQCRNGLLG